MYAIHVHQWKILSFYKMICNIHLNTAMKMSTAHTWNEKLAGCEWECAVHQYAFSYRYNCVRRKQWNIRNELDLKWTMQTSHWNCTRATEKELVARFIGLSNNNVSTFTFLSWLKTCWHIYIYFICLSCPFSIGKICWFLISNVDEWSECRHA